MKPMAIGLLGGSIITLMAILLVVVVINSGNGGNLHGQQNSEDNSHHSTASVVLLSMAICDLRILFTMSFIIIFIIFIVSITQLYSDGTQLEDHKVHHVAFWVFLFGCMMIAAAIGNIYA